MELRVTLAGDDSRRRRRGTAVPTQVVGVHSTVPVPALELPQHRLNLSNDTTLKWR